MASSYGISERRREWILLVRLFRLSAAAVARRTRAVACVWWLALVVASGVAAAFPREYQVKAIFLFNFTQFVDWPRSAEPERSIAICILGEDPFGSYLDDALRGEHVDNRALVVRRYRRAEDIENCQVLFISQSESSRIDAALARVRDSGTLTVSDARDFSERGGMVGFVTDDNRVRLRINVAVARAAGITISSKLLRVAEIIGDNR